MMSPAPGVSGRLPSAFSSSRCQGSVTTFLSLMISAIAAILEGFDTGAPDHVDEAFFLAVAALEVDLDQLLNHVGNLRARERRPDHFPERRGSTGTGESLVAADGNLV